MERQHIIFNLDDTLIECNKYFNEVIHRFTADMVKWFHDTIEEEVRQKQLEIDLKQVDQNGLTTEHFPESFVSTYKWFCEDQKVQPEPDKITYIRELGDSVFHIPVEPLPYLYETLEKLKSGGHELYIHTGGVDENQRRKIAQLQLAAYFDNRIFISLHKDSKALEKILNEMKFDKRVTWMVGNSPKTDIIPALQMGINTIYIPAENEWSYNLVDITIEPQSAYLKLNSLKEVPETIESFIKNRTNPYGIFR